MGGLLLLIAYDESHSLYREAMCFSRQKQRPTLFRSRYKAALCGRPRFWLRLRGSIGWMVVWVPLVLARVAYLPPTIFVIFADPEAIGPFFPYEGDYSRSGS